MKTIIINAGPRKNWNTDLMLKEAQKGAGSAGAETEYIDLYDLDFKGCRSCLACKIKGAERNKCYWKDDLSPVIENDTQSGCRHNRIAYIPRGAHGRVPRALREARVLHSVL